ncbi:hypothetical protein ACFQO9_04610 [Chryseobacterium zhengzhouense]|uniref:Uncharacterized protein n=1 Tax=Chryseobacterium zhengzhouense TaxID=1636086 RepID=A0ABW2LVX3_9FLAO
MIKTLRSPLKTFFSWIFREELNDLHYSITEHRILKKQYEKEIKNITSPASPISSLFTEWAEGFFKGDFLDAELVLKDVIDDMRNKNNFLKYCTTKTFKDNLRRYCASKGFSFNPNNMSYADGRIIRTINGKTTEMIYIKTTK